MITKHIVVEILTLCTRANVRVRMRTRATNVNRRHHPRDVAVINLPAKCTSTQCLMF